jgi:IclR helix-turn-helix domain
VLTGVSRVLRTIAGNVPVLVVAPWLSSRSQELLEAQAMNFIDLTGNAFVKLDNPPVYIRSSGAARNPEPAPRAGARARGPKAGRLIRLLADVTPPYGVRDIATATGLAAGYVSRLLDTLDREALIERSRRGGVEDVDVPGLLRSWARSYDVFRSNETATFLAPAGAARALARLAEDDFGGLVTITGSFAARRIAPVAAAALLVAYCDDIPTIVDGLGLMPADSGSNLALLRPFDRVVWDRTTEEAGLSYVAPSQAVVDCLTGTGRMPAEGEALLAWMVRNESSWRLGELEGHAGAA